MTKTLDKPRLPRRSVAKAGRKAAGARTKPAHKSLSRRTPQMIRGKAGMSRRSCGAAKAGWSPERRAKQAELVRSSKPWLKSTGPRTEEGKARSAANALKHGFRSRPFIEQVRNERQLIRDAGAIIALAKLVLGLRSAQTRGTILRTVEARSMRVPHITVWTGDPDLDGQPAHLNPPVKSL